MLRVNRPERYGDERAGRVRAHERAPALRRVRRRRPPRSLHRALLRHSWGFGKTYSARCYSSWDEVTGYLDRRRAEGNRAWARPPASLGSCWAVMCAPGVAVTPSRAQFELKRAVAALLALLELVGQLIVRQ
ncbi:MAG: hypothetical protein M0Z95_25520 [Actinomycetota bacterium]|nr:hypothetical protein [Actinomycetota bacterium]